MFIFYTYITYMYAYVNICEMNDSNEARDRMEKLGLFCYHKVFTLPEMCIELFESGLRLAEYVYCKL